MSAQHVAVMSSEMKPGVRPVESSVDVDCLALAWTAFGTRLAIGAGRIETMRPKYAMRTNA